LRVGGDPYLIKPDDADGSHGIGDHSHFLEELGVVQQKACQQSSHHAREDHD